MRGATSSVMPMVGHLEELRRRLLWSLAVVAIATAAALGLVLSLPVIRFLELPILPYLPTHKLAFTHPTDPFDISLHTSAALGIALSMPVILHHAWAFLQPAMTPREKRVVRNLAAAAMFLFAVGVVLTWTLVLPLAIQWLMGLETDALTPIVTAREYFSFAIDMALAFGIAFQLPIVIVALIWLDVVTPERLARFRRVALFLSVVIGAVLTPGDLVWTTLAMAAPLYVLYELGLVVGRRVAASAR